MRGEAEVGGPALSRNVRQIRERLGLSQTAFAAKVGLSQQTISKLEHRASRRCQVLRDSGPDADQWDV